MGKLGSFTIILLSLISSCYGDHCEACGPAGDGGCDDQPWAVLKSGIWWAWASPCSGWCSDIITPIPYGWRRATDFEFGSSANIPTYAEFGCFSQPCTDTDACAAFIFDPIHDHCDQSNFAEGLVTNIDNNGNWETVLVHDVCDECPEYILIEDGVARTFDEAEAYCEDNYHGLATIVTTDQFNCARGLLDEGDKVWIGLDSLGSYREDVFAFSDDVTPCPGDYSGVIYDGCVPRAFWAYKGATGGSEGRPRCPHEDYNENGSQCANLDVNYIDNDVQCEDVLEAVLCNKVPVRIV